MKKFWARQFRKGALREGLTGTYAGTIYAVGGVILAVLCLGFTGSRADLWVVRSCEELADAVARSCIDGTTKRGRSIEALLSVRGLVLGVALTSREQQMDFGSREETHRWSQ